jgi:hypothetical protein
MIQKNVGLEGIRTTYQEWCSAVELDRWWVMSHLMAPTIETGHPQDEEYSDSKC